MSRVDRAVALLNRGAADSDQFFEMAAEALVAGLRCFAAGVVILSRDRAQVRLLARYPAGGMNAGVSYPLASTPLHPFYAAQADRDYLAIADDASELYPDAIMFRRLGIRSFRGEVLRDGDGQGYGHVFAVDTRSHREDPESRAVFRLIANRIGVELGRRGIPSADSDAANSAESQIAAWSGRSDTMLNTFMNSIPDVVTVVGTDLQIRFANPAVRDVLGWQPQEMVGRPMGDFVHPDDLANIRAMLGRQGSRSERRTPTSYRSRHKSGEWIEFEASGDLTFDADGNLCGVAISRDVRARSRAERDLRAREEQFRTMLESAPVALVITQDGRMAYGNAHALDLLGVSAEDLSRYEPADFWADPDEFAKVADVIAREGTVRNYEARMRRKSDGATIWLSMSATPFSYGGRPANFCVIADITDRVQARMELQESESRLRDFAESASEWFWITDAEHRFVEVVIAEGLEMATRGRQALGKTRWQIHGNNRRDDPHWRELIEFMDAHEPFRDFRFERRPDREAPQVVGISGKPFFDADGRFLGYRGVGANITEKVKLETSMREAETRMAAAFDSMVGAAAVFDADDKLLISNQAFRELNSAIVDHIVPGTSFRDLMRQLAASGVIEDANVDPDAWIERRMAYHGNPLGTLEVWRTDNLRMVINEEKLPDGGTFLTCTDVSELRHKEEQLRQSQKMEAIGQLTGGIAHDFNNLLAVICGNLELASEFAADRPEVVDTLDSAMRAAQRGASLIHRLLAFSRQQPLQAQAVDTARLLSDMFDLLRRTLGESIQIEFDVAEGARPCAADPAQLEQAVLNLIINSRDAMPDGGVITIGVHEFAGDAERARELDVEPGDYVEISIADSGHGMTPEVRERVFEPFFTTKRIDQGTGLGLSMVFGFVKQSHGHITVSSAPGKGATFRLLLPAAACEAAPQTMHPAPAAGKVGEGRSALVVEDDPDLRALTQTMLSNMGFSVATAETGAVALDLLRGNGETCLLLSDIGLPGGLNGVELARIARQHDPGMRVLLMSGYADHALFDGEQSGDDIALLSKPFTRQALEERIARLLAG